MASADAEPNRRPSAAGTLVADSAEDMRRLGVRLGQAMGVGDVVALIGPLGAGKTTFAQGLAQGLEWRPNAMWQARALPWSTSTRAVPPFVHVDFYRLRTRAELPELGIEEAYDRAATAIEWADRFPRRPAGRPPADHAGRARRRWPPP